MLRNSFIDQYKPKSTKAKFIEREIALFHTDLNKVIYSQRPMSSKGILKLPKKTFPIFIDDVMVNNEVNTLLYSNNASKESNFFLKQKFSLLKQNYNKESPKKSKLSPLGAIMLKRNNIQIVKSLKDKISKFFQERNEIFENYKNKRDNFEKHHANFDTKLRRLYYKPVNEIRLEGFRRAYRHCLKKSKSDDNFELPSIQFNMEDVFSRLANNVIMSQKCLKEKINKEKERKEKEQEEMNNSYYIMRKNQIESLKNINNPKFKTLINTSSTKRFKRNIKIKNKKDTHSHSDRKYNDINIDINNFDYYYNIIHMPTLNISKILKFSSGKEFKIKITPRIKKRCISVLSCGPKPRISKIRVTSEKKEEEKEEEEENENDLKNKSIFNISNTKTKKNINNIILYNTLIVDKNNRGSNIVKVRNYRDENFNSNLHIAVLKDSIKLVQYFLNKKIDPNIVNKEGKTPLHLAMKKGNKNIIELLIKNGADTDFKDKKGKIPIDYASKETKHYFIFESQ